MEIPCRRAEDDNLANDSKNNIVFEDRSSMVTTPPPSYHYAILTSKNHGGGSGDAITISKNNNNDNDNDDDDDDVADPWVARMKSLDETVLEMRRAVQETQYIMKDMQTRFETTNHLLLRNSSSSTRQQQRSLRPSKSFTCPSSIPFLSDNNKDSDYGLIDNHNYINIDATAANIDADDSNDDDDDDNDDDDLDRITQSLQQLIDQAQSSLKTRLAIRDRSTMMHRSNSCPQMSTIYSAQGGRRQSETDAPSTPQLFDWNDQRERFFDSQSRLTQAIQELAAVCADTTSHQDSLGMYSPSHHQQASSPHIVHHHYHQEHHHHHYYHQGEQQHQEQHKSLGSHIFNYASLLRAISNSSAVAAAARRLTDSIHYGAISINSMDNMNSLIPTTTTNNNNNNTNKPLVIHPPRISLSKSNLIRLMFYITLLIFSFMNQQQLQQQHYLSKKCIAARRCVGQFVSHACDNLPISTWIQHSTLLVYIVTLL